MQDVCLIGVGGGYGMLIVTRTRKTREVVLALLTALHSLKLCVQACFTIRACRKGLEREDI